MFYWKQYLRYTKLVMKHISNWIKLKTAMFRHPPGQKYQRSILQKYIFIVYHLPPYYLTIKCFNYELWFCIVCFLINWCLHLAPSLKDMMLLCGSTLSPKNYIFIPLWNVINNKYYVNIEKVSTSFIFYQDNFPTQYSKCALSSVGCGSMDCCPPSAQLPLLRSRGRGSSPSTSLVGRGLYGRVRVRVR